MIDFSDFSEVAGLLDNDFKRKGRYIGLEVKSLDIRVLVMKR